LVSEIAPEQTNRTVDYFRAQIFRNLIEREMSVRAAFCARAVLFPYPQIKKPFRGFPKIPTTVFPSKSFQ
jgi:hypothetical protein